MFHYRVKISYKGTRFAGWQAQSTDGRDGPRPTVQGTIHQVLRRISRYQDCTIAGTSRTDAGVHAQGQVGKLSIPADIPAQTLLRGMNSLLPEDIRIVECETCPEEFNPKTISTIKEYHYYFSSSLVANPVIGDVVAHVPGPLDMELMRQAAELFVGEHDFFNFYRRSSLAASTVRTVHSCEVHEGDLAAIAGEVSHLSIRSEGFLKQMVRYIAGALFAVSQGTVSLSQVSTYLGAHKDDKLSPTARAKGLHLVRIEGA